MLQSLKISIISCFSLLCCSAFARGSDTPPAPLTESLLLSLDAKSQSKSMLEYGTIQGHVIVPQDVDPSSVVVQIGGITEFNQTADDFFVSVDKHGFFSFKNTFTVNSSIVLFFWDKLGILNKRTLPIYVNKNNAYYEVYMEKYTTVAEISSSFGKQQDFSKAGLCGQITGLSPEEVTGSEVYLQEEGTEETFAASYFDENNLPSMQKNQLSKNGSFCFLNVESSDNSFLYSLKLKLLNGVTRSFFVHLPSYTFASGVTFDPNASLFRKLKLRSWRNNFDTKNINPKKDFYGSLNILDISTSGDFSSVKYDIKNHDNLFYFPLSDEFLDINYSLFDSDNRFFFFQARNSLMSDRLLEKLRQSEFLPGRAYIDKSEPLTLDILDIKNWVSPFGKGISEFIKNQKLGSLFVNLDTTDISIPQKSIKFHLKNLGGQEFNDLIILPNRSSKKEISAIFHNIPKGLFQLFVTAMQDELNCENCTTYNKSEKLLWSGLLKSLPGKTQVMMVSSREDHVSKNGPENEDPVVIEKSDKILIKPVDEVNGRTILKRTNNAYDEEAVFLESHSLFFQIDSTDLCTAFKETEISFESVVPKVSIVPPSIRHKDAVTKKDNYISLQAIKSYVYEFSMARRLKAL